MGLEDSILEREDLKDITGSAEFSIDPKSSYERKVFVKRAKSLFDLQEDYARLSENINNMDALKEVIGKVIPYTPGDKKVIFTSFRENPHLALDRAELLLTTGENSMAEFVGNNKENLLSRLDSKQLYGLFANPQLSLYKTGNREYDKIKDLKEKVVQLQQAQKDGVDPKSIVGTELNALLDMLTDEQKLFINRNPDFMIPILVSSIIKKIEGQFKGLFRKGDNLDESALRNYLLANYETVRTEMNSAPNDEEAYNLWDKNLKPHYLAIAQLLYKSEKKKQKREDNPSKEDWIDEVEGKGMRT